MENADAVDIRSEGGALLVTRAIARHRRLSALLRDWHRQALPLRALIEEILREHEEAEAGRKRLLRASRGEAVPLLEELASAERGTHAAVRRLLAETGRSVPVDGHLVMLDVTKAVVEDHAPFVLAWTRFGRERRILGCMLLAPTLLTLSLPWLREECVLDAAVVTFCTLLLWLASIGFVHSRLSQWNWLGIRLQSPAFSLVGASLGFVAAAAQGANGAVVALATLIAALAVTTLGLVLALHADPAPVLNGLPRE